MEKKKMGRGKTPGRSAPKSAKKPRKVWKRGKVGATLVVKKPFRLEVGKRYENRIGNVVGPMQAGSDIEFYQFTDGMISYNKVGRHCGEGCHLDLVREVPGAKRPLSRKAKGTK